MTANGIREQITKERGSSCVIPRKRNSVKGNADNGLGFVIDTGIWWENAFAPLKQVSAIATRYYKLKEKFESMGSHGMWISVATYVKCQNKTPSKENGQTTVTIYTRVIGATKPYKRGFFSQKANIKRSRETQDDD